MGLGNNLPRMGLGNDHDVEFEAGGGKIGSSMKRTRGGKPYTRKAQNKKSSNQSQEDDFLASYRDLTNIQIVRKFRKTSTRIAACTPARKTQRRSAGSKNTKRASLKRNQADQSSIVKDAAKQSVFKRERKWKKLFRTNLQTEIKGNSKRQNYLEHAIDEVMKEFQKITIQEAWQIEKGTKIYKSAAQ